MDKRIYVILAVISFFTPYIMLLTGYITDDIQSTFDSRLAVSAVFTVLEGFNIFYMITCNRRTAGGDSRAFVGFCVSMMSAILTFIIWGLFFGFILG